jgi:hypothetical protein
MCLHYKDQMVNAIHGNNCYSEKPMKPKDCVGKKQFLMLKQVTHMVTTVF